MAIPIPAANTTVYGAVLTGAPDALSDLDLPISAFSFSLRHASPSYASITIPRLDDATDIGLRPNGDIVITHYIADNAGSVTATDLITVNLQTVRLDEGATSKSITLSGDKQTTYAPPFNTVAIEKVIYRATTDGARRWRTVIVPGLTPGDTVTYDAGSMFIGYYTVNVSSDGRETMEIVEGAEIT